MTSGKLALHAAAVSLLITVGFGHESAGAESIRTLSQDGEAEHSRDRLLAEAENQTEASAAANGSDEEDTLVDSISDYVFGDDCDRTEKVVAGLVDLSSWMSTLDFDATLADLTIPGTHHSGAYALTTTVNSNDPEYAILEEALYGLPDKVVSPWVCRFSLTQSLNLSEQLRAGIRYLDLRIDLDSETDTFRTFHVLFGASAVDLFGQIAEFVKENPTEIILVEINELFNPDATAEDKLKLRQIILDAFGDALIPEWDELPTVGRLQELGKTVLVSVQDEGVSGDTDLLWGGDAFRNWFANTPDLSKMISYNSRLLDELEGEEEGGWAGEAPPFNKLSWLLTPDATYIKDNVLGGSLYELAKEANAELQKFANDHEGKKKLGDVLLIDYVETSPLFDVLDLSDKSEGVFVADDDSGAPSIAFALGAIVLLVISTVSNLM